MNELPITPPGTYWEVTGIPRGSWVWSAETIWEHDVNGLAVGVDHFAIACAPGASAVLRRCT